MEALLVDDVTRRGYLERSGRVRRLFSAILPDPAAGAHVRVVGVARNLAEKIRSLDVAPDLASVSGAVRELLDRSVGAEEYVIRAAADGADTGADGLIDLNAIDFEALAARLAGRKRSSVRRLTGQLVARADLAARRNPARLGLLERLRELIDAYNAGSLNVDEMLRRLQSLTQQLSEDEQRTVREGLTEPELAVFDLLTQPDPVLRDEQRDEVKAVARNLMGHIEERLVLDWRKKAQTREAARGLVMDVLEELPDVYDPTTWQRKVDIVFNHIFASYYDDGHSVYDDETAPGERTADVATVTVAAPHNIDVDAVTSAVVERIRADAAFAELVAEQLRGDKAFFAVSSEELISSDETYQVEFKSTARWNLIESRKDKRMEDAVVKTVAGFLNTDGGTLFIGVDDARTPIGLGHDAAVVKPANVDGFVNWLTTHLIGALRHAAVMRTRVRIEQIAGQDVCRMDVARSSSPITATMSDKRPIFWVRMNNSTRALPEPEIEDYVRDRWRTAQR